MNLQVITICYVLPAIKIYFRRKVLFPGLIMLAMLRMWLKILRMHLKFFACQCLQKTVLVAFN